MNAYRNIILATLSLIGVLGCTIKEKTINGVDAAFNKAEYRVMYAKKVEAGLPGIVVPNEIVCMEPSPDVAKTTQTALSIIANLKGEEALEISHSKAEAIASLVERTTTIQLLRDRLFRTCEAYANGGISATNYSLEMSRVNKAMVTLMLAETAAGAFGRSGVVIGGKSSSEANLSSEGFGKDLEDALSKLEPIDKKIIDAKSEQKTNNDNLTALRKEKDETDAGETDKIIELNGKIDTLEKAIAEKGKEIAALDKSKQNTFALVQSKLNLKANTAAETTVNQALGSITNQPSAYAIEAIANMQDIYMRDSLADEVISTCVVEMGMNPPTTTESLTTLTLNNAVEALSKNANQAEKSTIAGILRKTMLSEFCGENLSNMVAHAEKNRQNNVIRYYELQTVKSKDSILTKCSSFSTEVQKTQCLKWAGLNLPTTTKKPTDFRTLFEQNELKSLEDAVDKLLVDIINERKTLVKKAKIQSAAQPITSAKITSVKLNSENMIKDEIVKIMNKSLANKVTGIKNNAVKAITQEPQILSLDALKTTTDDFISKAALIYQKNGGSITDTNRKLLSPKHNLLRTFFRHFIGKLTDAKKELNQIQSQLVEINLRVNKKVSG